MSKQLIRYFLDISYNGKNYHGWQVQKNAHSVQEELNNALKTLFQISIDTVGSGRTDTGVHALQQIVHMDVPFEINPIHAHKLNRILPNDIVIKSIQKVSSTAHARFDALSRKYEYKIIREKNPFITGLSYFFPRELNIEAMTAACDLLKVYKDFECFSKIRTEVDHFLCNIFSATWYQEETSLIFSIEANRFLRGMVRAIVGTMLEVGLGRMTIKQFEEIIKNKKRTGAGRSVPAEGLFLTKILYPPAIYNSNH